MSDTTGNDDFKGYRGSTLALLQREQAPVWSQVTLHTTRGDFSGPDPAAQRDRRRRAHRAEARRPATTSACAATPCGSVAVHGRKEAHYKIPEKDFPYDPQKPRVKLFGTGGTIASRLDYRTGAVIPAFSPGELYGSVPELADICNLETEKLYGVFSENMGPEQWMGTARAIAAEIATGVRGIVIGHGTDTMHHTAAALSFMLQDSPVPIVMVGSQRSSDRPSSDAAINLINATRTAATSDIAEVMVCMFGPTSDQYGLLHRGTRVRKMHSSYRSTFRTLSDIPLGMIDENGVTPFREDYNRRRDDSEVKLNAVFDDRVSLVYYYPNMKPDIIDSLVDNGYRGIVIAGTGLGHVNKPLYPALERARAAGVHVYMTVQTLWGYVQMYVYETGREIMDLGVVPAANMLPEVAYVKLGWALGQTDDHDEVKRIMLTPVNGEITDREPHNGYLVFQGGIPEVDEFISSHWK